MALRLEFEFYGDRQLDRTLERFTAAATDMTPAWEAMADLFVAVERRQFATEGRARSGGWAPLSPRYAEWKARHYPGRPILVREGDLRESLTQRPLGVEYLSPSRMVIGSDVEYGRYHQRGTPHMPRRRPVEFSERIRQDFVKIAQRHVLGGHTTIGPRGGIRVTPAGGGS